MEIQTRSELRTFPVCIYNDNLSIIIVFTFKFECILHLNLNVLHVDYIIMYQLKVF